MRGRQTVRISVCRSVQVGRRLSNSLDTQLVDNVLIAAKHSFAAPSHEVHHHALVDALDQEDGRRGVSCVVQTNVADPGLGQDLLPFSKIGARVNW